MVGPAVGLIDAIRSAARRAAAERFAATEPAASDNG